MADTKKTPGAPPAPKTPMTKERAAAIQSAEARKNGGTVSSDSFAATAQRAAAKSESTE